MNMITLKQINKAIKAIDGTEELVKGEGYFYFINGSTDTWPQTAVYVYRLNALTIDQWIEEYQLLKSNGRTK